MFSSLQFKKLVLVVMIPCYVATRVGEKYKMLGSFLCSESDIGARCIAGNNAFHKFIKTWSQQKIPIDRKIPVYEAQIVSIMMYNCGSWSPTAKSLEK